MKRMLFLLSLLSLAAVVACGGTEGNTASAPVGDDSSATHNDADIAFVQGMIPHHQQAVEMSDLALSQAGSPAVTELAEQIKAAQGPEIEQMQGFLRTWGVKSAGGEHGGGHGGSQGSGGAHPGMLSEDALAQLGQADGAQFDQLFLTGMIEHHRGAVAASQKELAEGESEEAQALAQEIIDAQEAEIAEMEQLLAPG